MSERAEQLATTADRQIGELIDLLSTLDQAGLDRPCPGREKLGDGTIGAAARHTADTYQRIAAFVQTSDGLSDSHQPDQHDNAYSAGIDVDAVVEQLGACRVALGGIAELNDTQLDVIPPKGSFRFCDGQRALEQVLAGLLKHQAHQVEALKTAVS